VRNFQVFLRTSRGNSVSVETVVRLKVVLVVLSVKMVVVVMFVVVVVVVVVLTTTQRRGSVAGGLHCSYEEFFPKKSNRIKISTKRLF
jgi:hypothetical protein